MYLSTYLCMHVFINPSGKIRFHELKHTNNTPTREFTWPSKRLRTYTELHLGERVVTRPCKIRGLAPFRPQTQLRPRGAEAARAGPPPKVPVAESRSWP